MPIGPLAQRRLDEPLGLPIGLRAIGPRELLGDAQLQASLTKQRGVERHAVVCQHALDGYTQTGEVAYRGPQECLSADLRLVGVDLREGQPAVVVHGHKDVVPADPSPALGAIAGDAVTDLLEAPELLDVDVQQLTGVLALVTLHGLLGPKIAQP